MATKPLSAKPLILHLLWSFDLFGAFDSSITWEGLKLVPTQPGLIEIRVTATDRDDFTATRTETLRTSKKEPGSICFTCFPLAMNCLFN